MHSAQSTPHNANKEVLAYDYPNHVFTFGVMIVVVVWFGNVWCMFTLGVEWWTVELWSQAAMALECMLCVGRWLLAASCCVCGLAGNLPLWACGLVDLWLCML